MVFPFDAYQYTSPAYETWIMRLGRLNAFVSVVDLCRPGCEAARITQHPDIS